MTDKEIALELVRIAGSAKAELVNWPDRLLDLYRKCFETVRSCDSQDRKPE